MGTDLHPYLIWNQIYIDPKGEFHSTPYGWKLYGERNYWLFGLLTNGQVRVEVEATGYAPSPRGVPDILPNNVFHEYTMTVLPNETHGEGYCSREQAKKWVMQSSSRWVNCRNYKSEYNANPDECYYITHPDWHSHSWLNLDELSKVVSAYNDIMQARGEEPRPLYEMKAVMGAMQSLDIQGCSPQFVFWFDN